MSRTYSKPYIFNIRFIGSVYRVKNNKNIHLRKLPTPPDTLLNLSTIRRSRVMKFHYCAFALKLVIERFLEFSNFIDLSDFLGSLTILTLRSSIIHLYKKSTFGCKWLTVKKEMSKTQYWSNKCITKFTCRVSLGNCYDTNSCLKLKTNSFKYSLLKIILNIEYYKVIACYSL